MTIEYIRSSATDNSLALRKVCTELQGRGGGHFSLPQGEDYFFIEGFTLPSGISLQVPEGSHLHIRDSATLTVNGTIDAGPYKIIQGNGTVSFATYTPYPINQKWFGTDAAAMRQAAASLTTGCTWYLPSGNYAFNTSITLPQKTVMQGDGPKNTILTSSVNGDYSIQTTAILNDHFTFRLGGFKLQSDASGSTPSSSTGGLYLASNGHELFDLEVDGFRSGAFNEAGDDTSELRPGILFNAPLAIMLRNVSCIKNDVGIYVTNTTGSIATTVTIDAKCYIRMNRCHAMLLDQSRQIWIRGAIFEANYGYKTVKITDIGGSDTSNQIMFSSCWWEANCLDCGTAAAGSRDLYFTTSTLPSVQMGPSVTLDNCTIAPYATAYPQYPIELNNALRSVIRGSVIGRGALSTNPVYLSGLTRGTQFVDSQLGQVALEDASVRSTTYVNCDVAALALTRAPDLKVADPALVQSGVFHVLPAITLGNFTGISGTTVVVQGNPSGGSVLQSSDNFQFDYADNTLRVPSGMMVTLRKDPLAGKWVPLTPPVNWNGPGLFVNGATQTVDSRDVWAISDGVTLAISQINGGTDYQKITIIAAQADGGTCQITAGGNIRLAGGAAFTMGIGDTLSLIYRKDTGDWYELSRSNN